MTSPLQRNPILNERWLNRATWWVNHRQGLWQFFVVLLFVVIILFLGLALYGAVRGTVLGATDRQSMLANLTAPLDYTLQAAHFAPSELVVTAPVILSERTGQGQYDALTFITNNNDAWLAQVTYHYTVNGLAQEDYIVTILNSETRGIIGAAIAPTASASTSLDIVNVRWQRLRNPSEFTARKPQLISSQTEFLAASDIRLKSEAQSPVSQARFVITNDGLQGLWAIDLLVIAQVGDHPVAARQLTIDRVLPGVGRLVTVNFPPTVPSIATIKVMPSVNSGKADIFMPLSATPPAAAPLPVPPVEKVDTKVAPTEAAP